jgi:hypothetical protein
MIRRFRPVSIPDSTHPLVRRLFVEMNAQQVGPIDMADRSGINKNTFKDWRTRTEPTIGNLDACLNVLGLELTVREKLEK